MGTSSAGRVAVREIAGRRARVAPNFDPGTRTVTAQLTVSSSSMRRLLRLSGSYTDFILSSADGSTTVRVGLVISGVPSAEAKLGASRAVVNWSQATLTLGTQRVELTRMELRLLAALYESVGAAVDRETLSARIWPHRLAAESRSALPVLVCSLRKRFQALGFGDTVRTVRGDGYSLAV